MGLSDYTCCKCGHGGYQFEFDGKRCTASILVKQPDGRWVEQTIAGVYDGYGHIYTRPDGERPRKDGGFSGRVTYEFGCPDQGPIESDSDYKQRYEEWKMKLPQTERFYILEPSKPGHSRRDAAFWERKFAEAEANPICRQFDTITLGSFMAFNVKCDGCSERKHYWPPPAESSLETFAEFRTRDAKVAAHQQVADAAEQALKGASG